MKILLVEDNEKLSRSLKKGLELDGYIVDCLLEGTTALRRILMNRDDYDLVILDIMIPGKDGISVCKVAREEGVKVPILMLTAKDALEEKILGLDSGADDYLIKPFQFEELTARIRALVRRPKEVLSTELHIRNIVLSTITHKVFVDKKECVLTLKEFSLLELFMRHPNQVLTREQMLAHVWDFAFDSLSNVVDVHVKNMRKKITSHGKEDYIETIRGVGYRLNT